MVQNKKSKSSQTIKIEHDPPKSNLKLIQLDKRKVPKYRSETTGANELIFAVYQPRALLIPLTF